jgi:hypothetical protein
MKLSDWLDEYRRIDPESIVRHVAEPEDDWEDPGLYAPADRLQDVPPLARARSARRIRTRHDSLVARAASRRACGGHRSRLRACDTP